jgi:hypothetical protein
MNARTSVAALITAATVTLPVTPAVADSSDAERAAASGCVSNAAYAQIGLGQTLSYIRSVLGDEAMISRRDWTSGGNAYKERVYRMCTPISSAHARLTTRFMYYQDAWRAFVVDTHLGPEPR